ncbi:MAG: restriction endonuclease subunit S, partial [Proteobacteria bacterium]|nr:restriction endonuclease subunit S [Pseudomonadota bacterium]
MINYDYSNIPQDWLVANLGKVAVFEDGKRIPLKEEDRSKIRGKYPYYGASGIIDYVNDYLFDQERILFAEDGANILMRSTPVAFKATGKYWVNNHAHVLKPNDNTNIDYLTTYLESLSYIKFNTGSTQPKLNRAICNKIPVLLPPLPEQKAIADLLSSWDEAIEKTERLIQTKEQFKIGQLQELITNNKA